MYLPGIGFMPGARPHMYVRMQHAVGVHLVYSNYPKWFTSGASGYNENGKLKF